MSLESVREQDIALLRLYCEKASELNDSAFLLAIREGPRTTFQLGGQPFRAVREGGPSTEAMKAFVLTFRLFLQDRDRLSFRAMESLLSALPVESQVKSEAVTIRGSVNAYLDRFSPFVIKSEAIPRRSLLDAWLYGEVAHVNPDKREILRGWRVEDDVRPLWQYEFESVVVHLTGYIFALRLVILRALDALVADDVSLRRTSNVRCT
jgi:hypothetical protein